MTTYTLCKNVKAVQAAPANGLLPTGSQSVNPNRMSSPINDQAQTFHVVVTTTSGNGSATVQPMVSNDDVNWLAYGAPIVVASGASPAQAAGNGSQPWERYTAYVTAISGTGASVTCTMGA